MIKSFKYSFLFLFLLFSSVSCKKNWLDEKSDKSMTVPSTLADLQALLNNAVFMLFQFPYLGEFAADGHYVTDALFQAVSNTFYRRDAYIWSKTVPHVDVSDWNNSYAKILIDNVVLDELNKIEVEGEEEQQQWNNIRGQALFHRARLFFELAQLYAPPYNAATAKTDLGIVLRLSSDITLTSGRSTVQQTYDQILNDLNEAKKLLPGRAKYVTWGSASATYALLARVYLSTEDYANAYIASDSCLKIYKELLNYNDISATANFIGRFNKEVLCHANFIPGFNLTSQLIERSLFESYKPGDLRISRFYKQNTNNTISFKGNYESVTNNYFCGIATDEVYLTRAECHARLGRKEEALKDLNDLLITRWDKNVTYPYITANNADEALSFILEERKKELIYRGTRWMDLRRLNKDPRFAITLKRTVAGEEYLLEPNSYKYTFPIPDDVILQTGIAQNPKWQNK